MSSIPDGFASLEDVLSAILPPNREAMEAARTRQQALAKPPGSLGRLEALSIQLSGIAGSTKARFDRRRLLVFAADNGVCREGVSSAPISVTRKQAVNIARGLTGAGVLARHFHAECRVIDVGVDWPEPLPGVLSAKVARGTGSIARGPAMTPGQALQALLAGANAALQARREGVQILGVGEIGIGNTTTSAAVLSALLGVPAAETAGRGGGIDDETLARKRRIIDEAVARLQPDPEDPMDVLCKVGGLDLCAMTGAFLGAAACRLPVVIDGFISAAAALCAFRLCPEARSYMIPSHASQEQGYRLALAALDLSPMLQLDMRLGEGSGCPMAFAIASASMEVLQRMATFEEARIDDGYLSEIRAHARYRGEA